MAAKKSPIMFKGHTVSKQYFKDMLLANDQWLYRGIMAIYSRQTQDEKMSGQTVEDNGMGFNGVDAEILTSFALQLNQRGSLSPKQVMIARKKMTKYAGQLEKIAKEKLAS